MSRCWLLMLGSNLPDDRCLQTALAALTVAGATRQLTEVVRRPSYDGQGSYFNVLIEHLAGSEEAELRSMLKQLEVSLGRVRDGRSEVAIDIDLLAELHQQRYVALPRAIEKGEFEQPLVQELLAAAGLSPVSDAG